ncbi:hypothetical protein F4677DRAFT_160031 [Hypoxylon crocopeplum]|nr:hypothetical protein F4677DRAFT_160031 [Hypoxylon crocopeplum]
MGWWPRPQLRQTHLGSSPDGKLVIVDFRLIRPATSPIFQLPVEIFCEIFEYLAIWESPGMYWAPCVNSRSVRIHLTASALSCKRFNQMAEPLLYRWLNLYLLPEWTARHRSFKLYCALKAHPERGRHCRKLHLSLPRKDLTEDDLFNITLSDSVIRLLANIQEITIQDASLDKKVWDLPAKMNEYMPRLQCISVLNVKESEIMRIIEGSDLPLLKTFIIWCAEEGEPRGLP